MTSKTKNFPGAPKGNKNAKGHKKPENHKPNFKGAAAMNGTLPTVKVHPDKLAAFKAAAASEGCSFGEWVRRRLDEWLLKQGGFMSEMIDTEKAREELFSLMASEHNVTLLQSESDDIIAVVLACLKPQCQPIETAPKDKGGG